MAVAADHSAGAGYLRPLAIASGAVAIALGLAGWLAMRARRPHSSLITSSMQDDRRQPPRK
jgi:hypothetical protein